jgi:signal transduction histidine kinase
MVRTRILIVEDEPLIALDIEESLTMLGYDVVSVADCAEAALSIVAQDQPDLVLMDIQLRGEQTGIEAAIQMQQLYYLPVVFLTAHTDEATLAQVKSTQPFGYIVKPFNLRDLSVAIEIALSRYQSEIQVRVALQKEKELNQIKSQFVSMLSHEFRNPLSSILFSLDLLDCVEQSSTRQKVYLKRARQAVEQIIQLIENVLTVGETDAKAFDYQPTPLFVIDFCQELVEQLQSHPEIEHSIDFITVGFSAANVLYQLDERLLYHILTNLLFNAIKYSPTHKEIRLTLICQEEHLIFKIQDWGIGIDGADRAHLFDSFYRGTNVGNIPGHGLGLAIVRQCVEAHQGTITFESRLGAGTTFTVTIPAVATQQ